MARSEERGIRVEWPTIFLVLGVYALWGIGLYWGANGASAWLAYPALILLTTLFSSIQHEVCHGHPTRNGRFNEALVYLPLMPFIPYRRFKRMHLRHHNDAALTDPYEDPESYYRPQSEWSNYAWPVRWLLEANNTLLGRIVFGPAISLYGYWRDEIRAVLKGDADVARSWVHHAVGLVPVLFLIDAAGWSIASYLLLIAYPGMAVLMIRTFAEHQAHEDPDGRTVIVENGGLLGFLFLNNNLHVVHHDNPRVAWYDLPRMYAKDREHYQAKNGGYVFVSYRALISSYLLKAKEPVAHPFV